MFIFRVRVHIHSRVIKPEQIMLHSRVKTTFLASRTDFDQLHLQNLEHYNNESMQHFDIVILGMIL